MVRPTLGSRTTKEQSSSNFVRLRYRGICLNLCRDYNAFVENLKYYRFDIIYIIIYVAEKSCRGIVLSGKRPVGKRPRLPELSTAYRVRGSPVDAVVAVVNLILLDGRQWMPSN